MRTSAVEIVPVPLRSCVRQTRASSEAKPHPEQGRQATYEQSVRFRELLDLVVCLGTSQRIGREIEPAMLIVNG